jgi:phosphoglycolate phosphatase-like HAD superfamily hydrolase
MTSPAAELWRHGTRQSRRPEAAVKLAIFDVDGTLLNNLASEDSCFADAVSEIMSLPALNTDWASYQDVSDSGIATEAYRLAYGINPAPHLLVATIDRFVERLTATHRTTPLMPVAGAEHLFTALPSHGWTIALATGAWMQAAAFKLTASSLPWELMPMATSEDGPARTDIVRCAWARAEGTHPHVPFERVVSIGDGVWDVETARTLKLPFVGVAHGIRAEKLRTAGASCVLTDFSDVVATLAALERAVMPLNPIP